MLTLLEFVVACVLAVLTYSFVSLPLAAAVGSLPAAAGRRRGLATAVAARRKLSDGVPALRVVRRSRQAHPSKAAPNRLKLGVQGA